MKYQERASIAHRSRGSAPCPRSLAQRDSLTSELVHSQVDRSLDVRAPARRLPSAAPQWGHWELKLALQQHPSTLLSQRLEVSRGLRLDDRHSSSEITLANAAS
ncbi:unnamed protein product [Pleuronectes platessa]|uniref:Uncharacterized protein n=1 Tax=Pleuronectes platessa TaxID=8262 RepID=A0A9N7UJJ1_PLEPL|nr:unnamed protein product [Pleuronectes platessa]